MASTERFNWRTPNQLAELTRDRYRRVRELAETFIDELFLIKNMKATLPGIEVVGFSLPPEDPTKIISGTHLWRLTYRDGNGDVCVTSLRKFGGRSSADTFSSFEMRNSSTRIEWDMYGNKKVTMAELC